MKRTLIRGGTLVTGTRSWVGDLLVIGRQIAALDPGLATSCDEVVDATGLHVLPGVIDDQVHFRQPGLEHKEDLTHATRACAKGGVTSFLEMPNTKPATVTVDLLHQKLEMASSCCLVNYGFYMGATPHNVAELKQARRTPGIKIFIGSSTGDLLVDQQEALERIFAETTLPITAHCEDEAIVRANAARFAGVHDVAVHSQIRDHEAAIVCTRRAISLAKRHKHRFHVLHVSTAAEIAEIQQHEKLITAEVCPHHLFFSVDDYPRLGSLIQMNPSIKFRSDNVGLWQALLDGSIQVVATDHAPHTLEEKQQPYPASPSGLPAVENSLALFLNQVNLGRCRIEQVVRWMCEAPAAVWNLKDKGFLRPGYDADLVLVDLQSQRTIRNEEQQTKCGWSPWHGDTLTGWPVQTMVGGQWVFRQRQGQDKPWFAASPMGTEIEFDHDGPGYWGRTDWGQENI
ncbi:MAG: dihydroorotase [Planctomycetaceae bacterium]|nr:dihydroorotase [Planctomycetaceae bacterium]